MIRTATALNWRTGLALAGAVQLAACHPGGQAAPTPSAEASVVASAPAPAPPASPRNACREQGGQALAVSQLRALGTEPFWNAAIDGRCVTYTTPENPAGTRVWARYAGTPGEQTWIGALDGKPFALRLRPAPGCSDGMSDEVFPLAARLIVGGETRTGCARPVPVSAKRTP